LGRLIAGTVPDHVLLPMAGPALRVFVPMARIARPTDDDEVRPTVVVDVGGPAGKASAVALATGTGAVTVVFHLTNLMHAPIRCLVPNVAGQNVHLAVPVHVGDGDAFGTEDFVDHRLLPSNRLRRG